MPDTGWQSAPLVNPSPSTSSGGWQSAPLVSTNAPDVMKALAAGQGDSPSFNDVQGSAATTAQPIAPPTASSPTQSAPTPAAPPPPTSFGNVQQSVSTTAQQGGIAPPQATGTTQAGTPAPGPASAAVPQGAQQGHDQKAKEDLTPPDLTQSAIPQPVSPNPPPPPLPAPAPVQAPTTAPGFMDSLKTINQMAESTAIGGVKAAWNGVKNVAQSATDVDDSLWKASTWKNLPTAVNSMVVHGINEAGVGLGGTVSALGTNSIGTKKNADGTYSFTHNEPNTNGASLRSAGRAVSNFFNSDNDKYDASLPPEVKAIVDHPMGRGMNAASLVNSVGSVGVQYLGALASGRAEAKVMSMIADRTLTRAAMTSGPSSEMAKQLLVRVNATRTMQGTIAAQAAMVSGQSAYEVHESIASMTPEQFAQVSPVNAAKMQGATPEQQQQVIAITADVAAQKTFYSTFMLSGLALKIAGPFKSNAAFGAATQLGGNIGKRDADPNQPLMQGVAASAATWGVIGKAIHAITSETGHGGADDEKLGGLLARRALALKAQAGMDRATPEQSEALNKQADNIQMHLKSGNLVHAAHAAQPKAQQLPTIENSVGTEDPTKDAVTDAVDQYINASNQPPDKADRIANAAAIAHWTTSGGGHTPVEAVAAFKELNETGELPDQVKENSNAEPSDQGQQGTEGQRTQGQAAEGEQAGGVADSEGNGHGADSAEDGTNPPVSADDEPATENQTTGRITEIPVSSLKLSKDVPQFKGGADKNGVVEPLGGTFDRRGTGPIQVWKRSNGQMEVISGRHRLDLASRSGEQTIPAQVYNESDGFNADQAASLDAELNIRDGQGSVKDYVNYFQRPAFRGVAGKKTAESRGLLARSTGRRAYAIAGQGEPELITAHAAGKITDEAAVQIAQAAPNDARLQALGMKLVQDGKPIGTAANTMRAVSTMQPSRSNGDMFGFDDSAINDGIKLAQAAISHQREISERLAAITGASKRPELARKEGVDVRDPKSLPKRIAELRAEKDSWDNFSTDPEKMEALRRELGMDGPKVALRSDTGADMFGGPKTGDFVDAASRAKDAERNGHTGGTDKSGDGGLFDGKRPEQADLEGTPAVSARAKPVSDALAEADVDAPVSSKGRVRISPNNPQAGKAFDVAANDAAESPLNQRKPLTNGQRAGGNYPMGLSTFESKDHGGDINVNIENPAGSIRKSADGSWQHKMSGDAHYGYFPGTHGADGEPLDGVFGKNSHDDTKPVFVIHQTDPKTGKFDEHKVVMGATTQGQAKQMYLNQYPQSLHSKLIAGTPKIVRMSREQFVGWLHGNDHATPISPMSKQPMLKLREHGELAGKFDKSASHEKLSDQADRLSKRFNVPLSVSTSGSGYEIHGDVPKAIVPSIYKSFRGIDGHEETRYNGTPASTVFPRSSSGVGEGVSAPRGSERGNIGERTGRLQRPVVEGGSEQKSQGDQQEAPSPKWLNKPRSDAPIFQRKQGKFPSSVVGVHYSPRADLHELDPSLRGSVIPEKGLLHRAIGDNAPAVEQRSHFYVRTGKDLPVKERAVGGDNPHAYEARLNNLYDVARDPEHVLEDTQLRIKKSEHRDATHDELVKSILHAGYDGTVHRGVANDTPVATVFGRGKIPVKSLDASPRLHLSEPKVHPVEQRLADKIGLGKQPDGEYGIVDQKKFDKAVDDYKKLHDAHGGKVISADVARELSPDYLKDRTLAAAVHEPASRFAKEYFKLKLAEPHAKGSYVLMTAGGTGAGKTTALTGKFASLEEKADFVYDTNMNNTGSAEKKIDAIMATGRKVDVTYVYRDPVDALRGAMARSEHQRALYNSGRTVPLPTHEETHTGSFKTMRVLSEHYKSNKDFNLRVVDNNHGKGGSVESTLDKVDTLLHTHADLSGELNDTLEAAYKSGEISKETYNGFRQVPENDPGRKGGVREEEPLHSGGASEGSGRGRPARQGLHQGPELRRDAQPAHTVTDGPNSSIIVKGDAASVRAQLSDAGVRILGKPTKDGLVFNSTSAERVRKALEDGNSEAGKQGAGSAKLRLSDQTKTPEFKRWFGESKVVDAKGEPLAVYHGTNQTFNRFTKSSLGTMTKAHSAKAFFFTDAPSEASGYADLAAKRMIPGAAAHDKKTASLMRAVDAAERRHDWDAHERLTNELEAHEYGAINADPSGAQVLPAYLSIKNPLHANIHGMATTEEIGDLIKRARDEGHDGLILQDIMDGPVMGADPTTHYVAFEPNQIKSATGNRGTFDPSNPDIRYSVSRQARPSADPARMKVISDHINKIKSSWKGAPDTVVAASRDELPDGVKDHLLHAMGNPDIDGMYYGGKVYLMGDALHSPAHAERVLVHETLGHYGLEHTFGDTLPNLLSEIHDSIKDSPAFKRLEKAYGDSYKSMSPIERDHAITEEYLSNTAEMQKNPGVVSKVLAYVRQWARGHGMVHEWTPGDVTNLMHGVAENVRRGRVSRYGYEAPTTTFNDRDGVAVSTYKGAAGEGSISHFMDGDREIKLGDLSAHVSTTMTDDGMALDVSKFEGANKDSIHNLAKFAGEEGKASLVFDKSQKGLLDSADVPYKEVGDKLHVPADKDLPVSTPRLSVRNAGGPSDPMLEMAKRTVAERETEMSPWNRIQMLGRRLADRDAWTYAKRSAIIGAVDRFHAIGDLEKANNGGKLRDASESAYKAGWMSQNTQAVMGAVVVDGTPVYKDGAFQRDPTHKGWIDILSPIYQTRDPNMERKFNAYIGAKRASRLINEVNADGSPREKNYTQNDIDLAKQFEKENPWAKGVSDDIQKFNHDLLDLAVERGNMTQETADAWKENYYVPFHRIMDDEESPSSKMMPGGLKVKSKYLSGGASKIEPPLDSMLKNTMAILDKIYKNEAKRRAIAEGVVAGVIHPIPMAVDAKQFTVRDIEKKLEDAGLFVGRQANSSSSARLQISEADRDKYVKMMGLQPPTAVDSDVTYAMVNGKAKYYRVDDPLLLRSIDNITTTEHMQKWFALTFGTSSKLLRNLTVHTPSFMFRHLFRQGLDAQLQSSQNPVLWRNSVRSAIESYQNGPLLRKLSMAGLGGNEYYNVDEMHDEMKKMQPRSGLAKVLHTPLDIAHAYHKVGTIADQMNRLSLAKSVLDHGGTTAEAAWQAQDLLNFGMHGDAVAIRYLMRAVPFLNARTQGAYRIIRGATGADTPGKVAMTLGGRVAKSFLYKGALLTAASLALALHNQNDPRYEKLTDEQKDLYYNFFVGDTHFALPRPFELGAIFSTIPERILRRAEGIDDNRTFVEALRRSVTDTMRLDPTNIALFSPIAQDMENKDNLSGRQIISQRYQDLDASEQFTAFGSPTIKALAQSMPDSAPDALRSPMRLQHLFNGYFSTIGRYSLDASDAAMRATNKAPTAPASNSPIGTIGNNVFGSMLSKSSTDRRNNAEGTLDDNYSRLVKIGNTFNAMQKQGEVERMNRYYGQNADIMQYKPAIKDLYEQMSNAKKAEIDIYRDPDMSASDKRDALNEITKERDQMLRENAPLLQAVDSL